MTVPMIEAFYRKIIILTNIHLFHYKFYVSLLFTPNGSVTTEVKK